MARNTALKIAIIQSGITQRRLSRKLRMDETRFSRIVSRQIAPTEKERKAIAKAVNYDEAILFPEVTEVTL